MYLSHGSPIPSGILLERYANKPWGKLHDALTIWGEKLRPMLTVEDAFPPDYKPSNISVSKVTIEKIRSLRKQGFKLKVIAEKVGCSFFIASTYAKE
jgi:hypothetical protein